MKNIFSKSIVVGVAVTLLFLTACSKNQQDPLPLTEEQISTEEQTSTDEQQQIDMPIDGEENSGLVTPVPEEVLPEDPLQGVAPNASDSELLLGIPTTNEAIISLSDRDDNNFLEEVPRVSSYYGESPFFEFYILKAIDEQNIAQCDKISDSKDQDLCKKLYASQDNSPQFISTFTEYGENQEFSQRMFEVAKGIKQENCYDQKDIIAYAMCSKMLDSKFDVKSMYIDYVRVFSSGTNDIKNLQDILRTFPYGDGFMKIVEADFAREREPHDHNEGESHND